MLSIYLNVTIEKNWRSQNFDFVSLKNLPPDYFLGSSNSHRYQWILKPHAATWNPEVQEQDCVWWMAFLLF